MFCFSNKNFTQNRSLHLTTWYYLPLEEIKKASAKQQFKVESKGDTDVTFAGHTTFPVLDGIWFSLKTGVRCRWMKYLKYMFGLLLQIYKTLPFYNILFFNLLLILYFVFRAWTPEEQNKLEELLLIYPPEPVEAKRFQKIAKALGVLYFLKPILIFPKKILVRSSKCFPNMQNFPLLHTLKL